MKHESLDDLQASTYFGPTTVSECVSSNRKHSNKAGKGPLWPVKSLSLNTEEGPQDFEKSFLNSKILEENCHRNISIISTDSSQHFQDQKEKAVTSPSGFTKKTYGIKTIDAPILSIGPGGLDSKTARSFREKTNSSSFQGTDSSFSVGTQTEQTEQKKVYEYPAKYSDREKHTFKHTDEESEIVSDDISDIFRFLDDMSVCDSGSLTLGVTKSSCYNSNGSQLTLKSEGDSSPERNTVKLAKSKLDRLFNSLESTDDELKSSVCKLVMRIGEIEKKLESLSGVRSEISQVLSKLNMLDEKIQQPEAYVTHTETESASRSSATPDKAKPHPAPNPSSTRSPCVFQCHTTGHNVKTYNGCSGEWCCSEGSNSNSLRLKALKKSMLTRKSFRSLDEDNGAKDNSPPEWRRVSYLCHSADEGKDKDRDRDSKDRHRKTKEVQILMTLTSK